MTSMARKLQGLRVLPGELSCADTGAGLLVVSQVALVNDGPFTVLLEV